MMLKAAAGVWRGLPSGASLQGGNINMDLNAQVLWIVW